MYFPRLVAPKETLTALTAFDGLPPCGAAASDTATLTPDSHDLDGTALPHLAARPPRGILARPRNLCGTCADPDGDGVIYLEAADRITLPEEGEPITATLAVGSLRHPLPLSAGEKALLPFGGRIVILPDGLSVDPDTGAYTSLAATVTTATPVALTLARPDGTPYHPLTAAIDPPENPLNGAHWLDIAAIPRTLWVYRAGELRWRQVASEEVCLRLDADGIGAPFAPGDGVLLCGLTDPALGDYAAPHRLLAAGENYLVLPTKARLPAPTAQLAPLTVTRPLPPGLDPATAVLCGERILAAAHTAAPDGSPRTYLCACRPGDPRNWLPLPDGEDTPAAAAFCRELAAAPAIVAAIAHRGTPHFFSESGLCRLTPTASGSFRLDITALPGVARCAARSLIAVGESLLYLSPQGMMQLDGDRLTPVPTPFDPAAVTRAAAGTLGGCCYLSLSLADPADPSRPAADRNYAYRPDLSAWVPQDRARITRFIPLRRDLCAAAEAPSPALLSLRGQGIPEGPVQWHAALHIPLGKHPARPCRLTLATSLPHTSAIRVALAPDSAPARYLGSIHPCTAVRSMPLLTPPCRSVTLHLAGQGEAHITSASLTLR